MSAGEAGRGGALGLGVLFGALAFCQGVAEPGDGLIAQPTWSLLKRWGHGPGDLGAFTMGVGLAWVLKPAFGLLTDFIPLFGQRRRGYLILAGGLAAVSMFAPAMLPDPPPAARFARLLGWMAASTLAWSMADVVADALLIDRGRPRGLVGRFQAVQWASAHAAGIVAGVGGGWLSRGHREPLGFAISGLAATGTMLLAAFAVREPRVPPTAGPGRPGAARTMARAARAPGLLGAGAFLFLWNFNPFSTVVLYMHMTRTLGLGEAFYGTTQSLMAAGSVAGCLAYPGLASRVSPPALVRLSIGLGVASTLALGLVSGPASAASACTVVGFLYMVATLIQLDLAARACPPGAAGTVFALLMAAENLAGLLSTGLGGWSYARALDRWGPSAAFGLMVLVGAACTASSWLILPGTLPAEVEGDMPG